MQIKQGSDIDYLAYIDSHDQEFLKKIKYTKINTLQKGTQQIKYNIENSSHNEKEVILKVDVVEYFDEIFNPLDIQPDVIQNPNDITVLVNKVHALPSNYIPQDLESVIDNSAIQLRREANQAYTKLYQEAQNRNINMYSISGYRTREIQNLYWTRQVKIKGIAYASKYSAYPDCSEHQLGLAIDISYTKQENRLSEKVAESKIGRFIQAYAYRYGFVLRYPQDKEAITNYGYEPWHIRYVGRVLAKKLYERNITLEEYYQEGERYGNSEI